jgi:hypothetical protein
MKTLDIIALVYVSAGFVFFFGMLILQYRWRIPGVPLRERFHGGQEFIRADRRVLYKRMFNVWIVVWATLMLMISAYAIWNGIRAL